MSYHMELVNDGYHWRGTFSNIIRMTVADLIESEASPDGEAYGPVEVTIDDGSTYTGTIRHWGQEDTFTITETDALPRIIDIEDVVRFCA